MYPKAEWARNGLEQVGPLPQHLPEIDKWGQIYVCDTCEKAWTDECEHEKCYENNYSEYKKEE